MLLAPPSSVIICEDVDVDKTIESAHFALFFNLGKCCCVGSRTFVHGRIYDEFLEKAKARALRRVVGDPFKKGVEQSPRIDSKQFEKVLRYIKSGMFSNATLEYGGGRLGSKDFFVQPTIFSNIQDDMLISTDEIFGPVQSILKPLAMIFIISFMLMFVISVVTTDHREVDDFASIAFRMTTTLNLSIAGPVSVHV